MILYLAGSLSPERLIAMGRKAQAFTFLETYAHRDAQECAKAIAVLPAQEKWRLFIDSGAFTSWAKGKPVDLTAYIAFCKELKAKAQCPVVFANLDVIPGSKADPNPPSAAVIDKACEEGWANYQRMKDEGIDTLPTFHQFEDFKWLEKYMAATDYVAISPRKSGVRKRVLSMKDEALADDSNREWIDQCFKVIGFKPGTKTPRVKIHGLGIASMPLMEAFPFYSVDSTAWLQGGRASAYRVFDGRRGELIPPEEWKHRLPVCVPAIDRYRTQGEADPNAEYGSYFFAMRCMRADVMLEKYITELWRVRGVVWDG